MLMPNWQTADKIKSYFLLIDNSQSMVHSVSEIDPLPTQVGQGSHIKIPGCSSSAAKVR